MYSPDLYDLCVVIHHLVAVCYYIEYHTLYPHVGQSFSGFTNAIKPSYCILSYLSFIINKVIFRAKPAALVPIITGSDL